jgi:hypothetical protein
VEHPGDSCHVQEDGTLCTLCSASFYSTVLWTRIGSDPHHFGILLGDGQLGKEMSDKLLLWHKFGFMPSKHLNLWKKYSTLPPKKYLIIFFSLYFQFLFSDPSIATGGVLALQAALVTGQLILLLRSHIWYHLLSQVSKCCWELIFLSIASSQNTGCEGEGGPPHIHQWRLVGPETHIHKITNVPVFLWRSDLMILRAHPFQWPS